MNPRSVLVGKRTPRSSAPLSNLEDESSTRSESRTKLPAGSVLPATAINQAVPSEADEHSLAVRRSSNAGSAAVLQSAAPLQPLVSWSGSWLVPSADVSWAKGASTGAVNVCWSWPHLEKATDRHCQTPTGTDGNMQAGLKSVGCNHKGAMQS